MEDLSEAYLLHSDYLAIGILHVNKALYKDVQPCEMYFLRSQDEINSTKGYFFLLFIGH